MSNEDTHRPHNALTQQPPLRTLSDESVSRESERERETERESAPFSVGEKLEYFYLCLVEKRRRDFPTHCVRETERETERERERLVFDKSLSLSELHYLAHSLSLLETHAPLDALGETQSLVEEISRDVRRKAATHIRAPYVDAINALITQCRKRLKTKTSLGVQSSNITANTEGNEHGQRYLYVLMDLLGSFSNMVEELSRCRFSRLSLQSILSPLYTRLLEMCLDTLQCYTADKDIFTLIQRSSDVNRHYEVSLHSLDGVAAQLGSMRRVVVVHYLFLFRSFAHYFSAEEEKEGKNEVEEVWGGQGIEKRNIDIERGLEASLTHGCTDDDRYLDRLLLVTPEEVQRWRELDFLYGSVESNYLLHAITEACETNALAEVEENAFIAQCVEDSAFLVAKCVERASLSLAEDSLCAVAERALSLLRTPSPLQQTRQQIREKSANNPGNLADNSRSSGGFLLWDALYERDQRGAPAPPQQCEAALLYALVAERAPYSRCHRERALNGDALRELVQQKTHRAVTQKREKNALFDALSPAKPAADEIHDKTSNQEKEGEFSVLTAMEGWSTLWSESVGERVSERVSNVSSAVNNWLASGWVLGDDLDTSRDRNVQYSSQGKVIGVNGNSDVCVTPSGKGERDSEREREREALLTQRPTRAPRSERERATEREIERENHLLDAHTPSRTAASPLSERDREKERDLSVEALLLQALDIHDEDGEKGNDTYNYMSSDVYGNRELRECDKVVQLNSLAALCQCVEWVTHTLEEVENDLFPQFLKKTESCSVKSKTRMLIEEYNLCVRAYDRLLRDELTHYIIVKKGDSLSPFLSRPHNITGDEMEHRWHDHHLRYVLSDILSRCALPHALRQLCVSSTVSSTETTHAQTVTTQPVHTATDGSESWMSLYVQSVLLQCLSSQIAEVVYKECVLRKDFNEWGALLLNEEVRDATRFLTQIASEIDTLLESDSSAPRNERVVSESVAMRRLHWACKLLTLDNPSDIVRYTLGAVVPLFTEREEEIRLVMSRRVEFSRDAVRNVTLRY